MTRNSSIVSVVAGVLVAVGGVMYAQRQTQEVSTDPPRSKIVDDSFVPSDPGTLKSPVRAPIPPPVATTTDGVAGRLSARLQAELVNARDWRAFAISAQARPAEGGYYYAHYAAGLCSRNVRVIEAMAREAIVTSVRTKGTVEAAHLRAVDDFSARCAAFAQDEAAQLWRAVRSKQADGLDPLVRTEQLVLLVKPDRPDPALLREATASLLATGDPLLYSQNQLLERIMSSDPAARKAGGMFFEGSIYSPNEPEAFTEFLFAAKLGVCTENAACNLDDEMVLSCISRGHCASDRRGHVKNEYMGHGGTAEGLARISALENRIRAAAASGSVSSFVR